MFLQDFLKFLKININHTHPSPNENKIIVYYTVIPKLLTIWYWNIQRNCRLSNKLSKKLYYSHSVVIHKDLQGVKTTKVWKYFI